MGQKVVCTEKHTYIYVYIFLFFFISFSLLLSFLSFFFFFCVIVTVAYTVIVTVIVTQFYIYIGRKSYHLLKILLFCPCSSHCDSHCDSHKGCLRHLDQLSTPSLCISYSQHIGANFSKKPYTCGCVKCDLRHFPHQVIVVSKKLFSCEIKIMHNFTNANLYSFSIDRSSKVCTWFYLFLAIKKAPGIRRYPGRT